MWLTDYWRCILLSFLCNQGLAIARRYLTNDDHVQAKPRTVDALLGCGIEAVRAEWIAPFVTSTVQTAEFLDKGKAFEDLPDYFWEGAWRKCSACLLRKLLLLCLTCGSCANYPSLRLLFLFESLYRPL
jgi:hypothetical protein